MSTDTGFSFSYWDLNKSKFEEADSYAFTSPTLVFLMLAIYLLFILKIGPSYMKNREPYKLKIVLVLYNAAQVYVSIYMTQRAVKQLLNQGFAPKTCLFEDETHRKEILSLTYMYYIAKITELLDTLFFVLRKKDNQITFLHVYHHCTMLFGTWAFLKHWYSVSIPFGIFMNSLIHSFMYTYYGLSALGPKVTKYMFWKKHMTKMQLVQFLLVISHYIISLQTSECPSSYGASAYYILLGSSFFILFLNFYFKSYTKNKSDSVGVCKLEKDS